MSNGVEMAIENLKTELRDINLKISELRKAGLDTKVAELKVMNIPYKIQFAEVTKGYRDIEKVNSELNSVKEEINEIKYQNEKYGGYSKSIKKELENYRSFLQKQDSGEIYKDYSETEIVKRVKKIVEEAYANLSKEDYYKALHNYLDIKDIYRYLPKELKRMIYGRCIDIYKKIIKSGIIGIHKEEKVQEIPIKKINIFKRFLHLIKPSNI